MCLVTLLFPTEQWHAIRSRRLGTQTPGHSACELYKTRKAILVTAASVSTSRVLPVSKQKNGRKAVLKIRRLQSPFANAIGIQSWNETTMRAYFD